MVGDLRQLEGVFEQAGDERPAGLGQLVLRAGLVEHVAVTLEERQVGMHAGTGILGE